MTDDITYLDATELAARIRSGALTSVQVVQAHLDRITAVDPKINAIVTVNENALAEARAADDALAAGEEVGPCTACRSR